MLRLPGYTSMDFTSSTPHGHFVEREVISTTQRSASIRDKHGATDVQNTEAWDKNKVKIPRDTHNLILNASHKH